MKLSQYISQVGYDAAAMLFAVPRRTVESWKRLERSPRPDKAREIERVTKKKVTFAECYESRDAA